jgi:aryl carrier-like protein
MRDKLKLEPNKIIESNIISKDDEIYQKGIDEVRNIQINESKTKESSRITFQNIIQRIGKRKNINLKRFKVEQN